MLALSMPRCFDKNLPSYQTVENFRKSLTDTQCNSYVRICRTYRQIDSSAISCAVSSLNSLRGKQGRLGPDEILWFCRKVWYLGQNGKTDRNYFKKLQCQKLTKNKLCDRTPASVRHRTTPARRAVVRRLSGARASSEWLHS